MYQNKHKMELEYLKCIEQHKLDVNSLPEDAQLGIDQINDVVQMMKINENRGRKISEKTFKKLAAMDKWVCLEIMDFVNKTEKNKSKIPHKSAEVIAEEERLAKEKETMKIEEIGVLIDQELVALHNSGKTTLSLDELKTVAPTAYNTIFDAYEDGGKNGVETSHFSLIETSENQFTLTKK